MSKSNLPYVHIPPPIASGTDSHAAHQQAERLNNAPCNQPSQDQQIEMVARRMAESRGCYIDKSIIGLVVRSLTTDDVIAKGFHGFQAILDAYDRGDIPKAVEV
ncbi:hypothetical protein A247_27570 [Pseudomonas syringae pv. actinidiae ICMP 19099]|uniref:hypothetical protein n=1 Tax=Pseudomonas syringae TaxID=317 RepID=UPI000357E812|nr:hypothetical protein [Pseudomonas syringae]EPN22692.1 hypothetical protein A247_27570 [Pseudomonas syringae pv. actinidiae ICMP 19099]